MGFLIFMTITNLFIPSMMIIFGILFIKKTPKKINHFYGYRTRMSMKSPETWEFSHIFIGKLWSKFGCIILICTILSIPLLMNRSQNTIGIVSGIISGVQVILMIGLIIPVEIALRKKFDNNGKRR